MRTDTSIHVVEGVLQALCHKVGSPRALTVSLLLKYKELGQLLNLRTDPMLYLEADSYRRDNACTEFLRKCRLDSVISPKERRASALQSFDESEKQCCLTNIKILRLRDNHSLSELDLAAIEFLNRAKRWISTVLGALPNELHGAFGPGSTYLDQGKLVTIPDKISSRFHMTPGVEPLLPFIERTAWWRYGVMMGPRAGQIEEVRGNRFTTVPKTSLTDRGICIEPTANLFLQKAVGSAIRSRLSRGGVDLRYAQFSHQAMACEGSLTGDLATIDLSNASDTVSLRLVEYLLPSEWFHLLLSLRSPLTQVGGKWRYLEKFSSMGNGFTFELETLIFASLAHACGAGKFGSDFSVFGDDIIVPTHMARELVAILRYCGFKENPKKTFLSGYFRESCGGDFFFGQPVRAYNVEEPPSSPEDWISMANGIFRLGCSDPGGMSRDGFTYSAWNRCLSSLPSNIRRLRGPATLGDLVINDLDESRWRFKWKNCIRYFQTWSPVTTHLPWHHWKPSIVYAAALYGVGSEGPSPRGHTSYKVGWVACS